MPAPGWVRSARFRIALLYSVIVFVIGALVTGVLYLGLARSLQGEPVSQDIVITEVRPVRGGLSVQERVVRAEYRTLEQLVNDRTLDNLRTFSLIALGGLFPLSLLIGWLVAGRVLAPIGRISAVARDIQARDLSQRIQLEGPDDEIKQLADTFDAMLDRVEAGVEEQRAFIQDASHELRNPLAVMATNLDVVLADPAADAAELRHTAEVVRRTVERTARTVDELVLFTRQESPAGKAGATVDLAALAAEVAAEFRGPAAARTVDIEVATDGAPQVKADPDALRAALGNLLGNAVRLAPPGSTITCGSGARPGWAWVGVRDQGPGIAPDRHELVFRRFWRDDTAGTESGDGAGLGLAIVRDTAAMNRGLVTVRSIEGEGSSFVVWLPVDRDASSEDVTADGLHPLHDPLW